MFECVWPGRCLLWTTLNIHWCKEWVFDHLHLHLPLIVTYARHQNLEESLCSQAWASSPEVNKLIQLPSISDVIGLCSDFPLMPRTFFCIRFVSLVMMINADISCWQRSLSCRLLRSVCITGIHQSSATTEWNRCWYFKLHSWCQC